MYELRRFVRDRNGATAIEYAMIAMLIALTIIGAVTTIGHNVAAEFNSVSNGIKT